MAHTIEGVLVVYMRQWIGGRHSEEIKSINHLNISLRVLLPVFPLQDSPSVLVKLECENDNVARVDANGGRGAIGFIPLHTVNVNNPLLSVNLRDLTLTALVFSSNDANFIIFSNG